MGAVVGIDLGTSNSAIAIQRLNAEVLLNGEGGTITPSCVSYVKDGDEVRVLVGQSARDLRKQHPRETVVSVKRLMGRDFHEKEVRDMIDQGRTGYPIATDEADPGSIHIPIGGERYTPESVSSQILRKLVGDARSVLGEDVSQAVVTVPAYFNDRQKFATRKAADLAGIGLLRLLPEPTAAAISYGVHEMAASDGKTVMVFDLGGGTFDVSILSVVDSQFMEVTKGGDMWLGGDDVDRLVRDFVFRAVESESPGLSITERIEALEPGQRARFQVEILEACERAKVALSSAAEATVEAFGTLRDDSGSLVDIDVTIRRSDFDELLKPMAANLVTITERILKDVGFDADLIDMVLMVGGSSLIPCIQQALRSSFGESKVHVHPRPLHAVVEGAAIMARSLAGQEGDSHVGASVSLMHSSAHSYFLQLVSGKRHELLGRNSPLPAQVTETLTFVQAKQVLARLRILNDVDGMLEPIGELWAFRDGHDPLGPYDSSSRRANTEKKEFVLDFRVDEDNIISMTTSLHAGDGDGCIVRGGAAVSLFQQLETALARVLACHHVQSVVTSYLRLSKLIVDSILQVIDPVSGMIDEGCKRRILKQIDTIAELAEETNSDPLWRLHLIRTGVALVPGALGSDEVRGKVALLEAALRDLTDVDLIENLLEELDFQDDDILSRVLSAVAFFESVRDYNRADSDRVIRELRKFSDAWARGDKAAAELYLAAAEEVEEGYYNTPVNGGVSFDRDVELAGR